MKRSESKYFNTAIRMDQAFLELLEKKDMEYITVKEICKAAGVNRSTFYLHYETIGDLLAESVQYINEEFLTHMSQRDGDFVAKIKECPLQELYLVTPEYLTLYLEYIAQHRRLFCTMVEKAASLRMDQAYDQMLRCVFGPILERFQVAEQDRAYMMAFYMQGLMAIVSMWVKNDCSDSISHVSALMEWCVMHSGKASF